MDYLHYGERRELIIRAITLEEELIKAYQELGMDRGDAKSAVEAIIMKAN